MKTFFFQRPDGSTFAAQEQEAAEVIKRGKFKYLGTSDGATYSKIMESQREKLTPLKRRLADCERRLDFLNKKEDDLLMVEDDRKVEQTKKLIIRRREETFAEMEKISVEMNDIFRGTHLEAMAAEIEIAKNNLTPPQVDDIFYPQGKNPQLSKIVGNYGL